MRLFAATRSLLQKLKSRSTIVRSRQQKHSRTLFLENLEVRRVFAAFTPGNLAIYRVGAAGDTLANTGNTVFIDEYTPAGGLVQSIQLPNSGGTSLVANGISTSEGSLSRSADGNYLLLAGYGPAAIPDAASLPTTTAATVNRVIGRIGGAGDIDTTTRLTDAASGGTPRSATSTNGQDLWFAGTPGGVRATTLGATTSTQLSTTTTNIRTVAISNGQLFVTSASGATRVATVGTGLPTTSGQTITNLPGTAISGLTGPYGTFFADLSPGVPGDDTLYLADDTAGALQKFSLVGTDWVSNGIVGVDADDYRGVTALVSGSTVSLFATRKGGSGVTGGGELVSLVDSSGYNGAFAGTPTVLATAASGTAFRGIATTPGIASSAVLAVTPLSASKLEGDSGTTAFTFTVSRSGLTTGTSSANWAVTGSGATPANAADFQGSVLPSGTVNFAADELSQIITVNVVGDNTNEPDDGFTLTLSGPSVGTTIGTAAADGSILNDDAATEYQIVATDLAKAEGTGAGTTFIFTVNRTGDVTGSSTVDYTITGASNATDFTTALTGTVSFANNETSQAVNLTVNGDTNVELDENFVVTLSNPSAGTVISVPTVNGTIFNDDTTISIQGAQVIGAEGNSGPTAFVFTVTRAGLLSNVVTANWDVSGGATNPADGADFVGGVFPTGVVTFPGDGTTTTQTITVNVQGDTAVELDETFAITLSAPSAATLGNTFAGTGLIENDEVQPLSPGDVVITGMNTAGDDGFSFVPLVALLPGTTLKFTDNAWNGSALTTNEGYATFIVGASGIAAGTEVTVVNPTSGSAVSPATAGDVSIDSNFALSATGENLLLFQGARSAPAFLFAVNFGGPYLTSGSTSTTSTYLPSTLFVGTSAVDNLGTVGAPIATARYNDSLITGTKAELRDAVALAANWIPDPLSVQDFVVTASTAAPKIETVLFGNGVQRSMVTSITVNFDSDVALDPNAFLLEVSSINGGGAFAAVAFTVNQSVPVLVAGKSVVTLTFSGTGISGGSLADGNYRITALSSKIRSTVGSIALDGDNNGSAGGDFIEGESPTDNFFRLFGDSDGNGVMNPIETNRFRATVGRSTGDLAFNPLFDVDGNGSITPADTNQFRQRVGKTRAF